MGFMAVACDSKLDVSVKKNGTCAAANDDCRDGNGGTAATPGGGEGRVAATFIGLPPRVTLSSNAIIQLKTEGLKAYRWKGGPVASTDCKQPPGYSAAVSIEEPIALSAIAAPGSSAILCAVAQDTRGRWQDYAQATELVIERVVADGTPFAVLAGVPTGESMATVLGVTVSGVALSEYRAKTGPAAVTDCADANGYGPATPLSVAFTADVSAAPDGPMRLCVVGHGDDGRWQSFSAATVAAWAKDTLPPTASLSGAPVSLSNAKSVALGVGGAGVVAYRAKAGSGSSTDCADVSAYTAATAIGTPFVADLSTTADGSVTVCVVGRDAAGNWQAWADATSATWVLDTTGPVTATLAGAPSGTSNLAKIRVGVGGTDVVSYRAKWGISAATDCAADAGYGTAVAASTEWVIDTTAHADGTTLKACVRGYDAAGNAQTAPAASATWTTDKTPVVAPRWANAPQWNDYVNTGTGDACGMTEYYCAHGGEQRIVRTGVESCAGLTLTDSLGVFDWTCALDDGGANPEAVFTSRLKARKGLRDLIIPGSPAGSWRPLHVTLAGLPLGSRSSPDATWWTNPIAPLASSSAGLLVLGADDEGKILTIDSDMTSMGINTGLQTRIAIVVFGATTTIRSTIASANCGMTALPFMFSDRCMIAAPYIIGFWLEGGIWDGGGNPTTSYILQMSSPQNLRIRGVVMRDAATGINASTSIYNAEITDTQVSGMDGAYRMAGIALGTGINTTLERVLVTHSGMGIDAAFGMHGLVMRDVALVNNRFDGLDLVLKDVAAQVPQGSSLQNVLVAGNAGFGIKMRSNGGSFRRIGSLSNITAVNNGGPGISSNNGTTSLYSLVFQNVLSANNGGTGLELAAGGRSHDVAAVNLALAANGGYGIAGDAGSPVRVGGVMLLGANAAGNCNLTAGTPANVNVAVGGVGSDCSPTAGLLVPRTDLDVANSFVGQVNADARNAHGSAGTLSHDSITDWVTFEHGLRAWGRNGGAFPASGDRSHCGSGMTCRIWDFALSGSDAEIRDRAGQGALDNAAFIAGAPCPAETSGSRAETWTANGETVVFLRNAVEITTGPLAKGNGNGLCEAGENCLYTPNFGAYQGHGALASCQYQANGGPAGIAIYGHVNNGR